MAGRFVFLNGAKSTFIDLAQYGEGFGALYGESATPSTVGYYAAVAFMYRAIDLRANSLSGVPWAIQNSAGSDLYISTGNELPTPFPWLADLRALLWQTEAALCLTSTAYWHKLRRGSRQIGVRWLQPSTMTPVYTGAEPHPVSYKRQLPGSAATTTLPAADVAYLYLPGIDETAPRPSPAAAASIAAGVLYNTDRFVQDYFKRGAIKATLLGVPPEMPKADREALKAWYQRVVEGLRNAWSANVIGTNAITPVVIGSGIDELSNNTLTSEKREDIATALGVPHSLVMSNAANFATAEADRLNFYETTILPEAGVIAAQLNRQIFQPLGLRFEWRASEMAIYQEDEEQRAQAFKTYVDAGIPLSIAAQMLGLNLPEGITPEMLDPEPSSAPSILPALPPPPLQLTGPAAAGQEEYAEEVRKLRRWAKGKLAPDVTKFHSVLLSDTQKRSALGDSAAAMPPFPDSTHDRKALLLLLDPDDDEAESKVRRKLEKQSTGEIAKALQDILDELTRKGETFEHAPAELAKEFNGVMKEMKQARKLRDPVERMLVDGVDLGVQTAVTQFENVGFSFAYDLANVAARDWARRYAGELVTQIDDTTRTVVKESLARWIENGEPLQALIDDIAPVFGEERAARIASTEVTRAFSEGSQETYRASEQVDTVEMRNAEDERVCEVCGPIGGERYPLDDGHPELGFPPFHVNCRCWVVPVVEWGR